MCAAHVRLRGQSRHDLIWMSAFAVAIVKRTRVAALHESAFDPKRTSQPQAALTAKSMNDFARLIAAGEICPSFAFSFKPLDPTVLVHHPPTPKCVIRAIG